MEINFTPTKKQFQTWEYLSDNTTTEVLFVQYRQMRDKILGLYVTKTDVTTNGKDIQPTIINIIKPNE